MKTVAKQQCNKDIIQDDDDDDDTRRIKTAGNVYADRHVSRSAICVSSRTNLHHHGGEAQKELNRTVTVCYVRIIEYSQLSEHSTVRDLQ